MSNELETNHKNHTANIAQHCSKQAMDQEDKQHDQEVEELSPGTRAMKKIQWAKDLAANTLLAAQAQHAANATGVGGMAAEELVGAGQGEGSEEEDNRPTQPVHHTVHDTLHDTLHGLLHDMWHDTVHDTM